MTRQRRDAAATTVSKTEIATRSPDGEAPHGAVSVGRRHPGTTVCQQGGGLCAVLTYCSAVEAASIALIPMAIQGSKSPNGCQHSENET